MSNQSKELTMKDGVDVTVMAIREQLMLYFKGTCINRFSEIAVSVERDMSDEERQYQYQRRQNNLVAKSGLYFYGSMIMRLERHPNRVTFYTNVFTRSICMVEVQERVKQFLETYLGSVELKEKDTFSLRDTNGTADAELFYSLGGGNNNTISGAMAYQQAYAEYVRGVTGEWSTITI